MLKTDDIQRVKKAVVDLEKAHRRFVAASMKYGQADPWQTSDSTMQRLKDTAALERKDRDAKEHELHCVVVEAGLAERDESRYGNAIVDRGPFGSEVMGYRREPSI